MAWAMCGFITILGIEGDPAEARTRAVQLAKGLRHRGPDWSGVYADDHAVLAHERLAIVDVHNGAQPLIDAKRGSVLAVNGEIYNHKELRAGLSEAHPFRTESDCEVLLYLYAERGAEFLDSLDGDFAFVLYDPARRDYLIARDHIGIVPLYWGKDTKGQRYVASEMKTLVGVCTEIEEFPPGHYYLASEGKLRRYYDPEWRDPAFDAFVPYDPEALRATLEAAVTRRMMCDVPYGLLISGGVDSSIIAALCLRQAEHRTESDSPDERAWWPRLHSFCIGLDGAPDLANANKVAAFIGAAHHELHYTLDDGLDALRDAIYHLETFDVTTIRAGTPMYLLARKIKSMGIKMVLSGEGADETFAGYLYFHRAPDPAELRAETLRKLFALHKYDCLRANKAMAAWGVEARVPFLSRHTLDHVMRIDPAAKMPGPGRMEKHILRDAFTGTIPDEVLWRQKEQFSDGVGYSWIDTLKQRAGDIVTEEMMRAAAERFPVKTPLTKEGYYYRTMFDELFPGDQAAACVKAEPSIACSSETALRWDAAFQGREDPSGRAVAMVHKDAY
jgi:asparagine synthase (glutamine-hydrolysing)